MKLDLTLQEKQFHWFNSEATEILCGGAAGGGKSHFLRVASILWAVQVPGIQIYLFRRNFPDLYKNHMEGPTGYPALLANWLQNDFAKINFSDNTITFYNRSKIFLCHCQHEKSVFNYQGAEIHVLMVDELTHFSESMYRFLRNRVRLGSLAVPAEHKHLFPRIVTSSNPGNVGHNWVKKTFVDFAQREKIKRAKPVDGGMLRQYLPAVIEDNPILLKNDPGYLDRLTGLGNKTLVDAMRYGKWDIVAGGMFDDVWSREVHVIEPFEIPKTWRIDRSFDWGSSKPFSVGWWAESNGDPVILRDGEEKHYPKGTLFRVAEWYGTNGEVNTGLKLTAGEIARGIKEREKFIGHVQPGPADNSIFDRVDGDSIAAKMQSAGVRWTPSNKAPGSRVRGWDALRALFKASLVEPMEDPGIFIFSTCSDFIRTVPVLPRDDRNADDVNTNAEDHIADEARYRIYKRQQTGGLLGVKGI